MIKEDPAMFKNLFTKFTAKSHQEHQAELYRRFLAREAKIGGELFGPLPQGGNREFFCLDETMWVWHEERPDQNGELTRRTTRYDVRPEGIFKDQNGNSQL